MFIRDLSKCKEIKAGDDTRLRELFNPLKDQLDLRYSLAVAGVAPGETTRLHKLASSEVYYMIRGEGCMRVGDEKCDVREGQAVYIPPGFPQQITNTGDEELVFLCIVDPAWKEEDEEIIG